MIGYISVSMKTLEQKKKYAEYMRKYMASHPEKREWRRNYLKKYYAKNKKKLVAKFKIYRLANTERKRLYDKEYNQKNHDKILERCKKYRIKNAIKRREYQHEYAKTHKPQRYLYLKKKWSIDPRYRLSRNVWSRIYRDLKNRKGGRGWEILVGYTLEDLMQHLESSFEKGMTWNNYGQWHLDHIIPISNFNYQHPEDLDFKKCWGLENLQPLWAKDNLMKHTKLNWKRVS
jgi:hypothetical protein